CPAEFPEPHWRVAEPVASPGLGGALCRPASPHCGGRPLRRAALRRRAPARVAAVGPPGGRHGDPAGNFLEGAGARPAPGLHHCAARHHFQAGADQAGHRPAHGHGVANGGVRKHQGGFLEHHLPAVRELYKRQCGYMLDAMEQHFPKTASWTKPEGGMFIWVTLPAHLDGSRLLERALARNVAFVPGAPFYADHPKANTLRLSFVTVSEERIREGIAILGELIAEG